jgi:hypothetical protein
LAAIDTRNQTYHDAATVGEGPPPQARGWWPPHRLSLLIVAVGLVVTTALTVASHLGYVHNEQRLTTLETRFAAAAFEVAPLDLERRLGTAVSSAAQAADPVAVFRAAMAPSMGGSGNFVTASLVLVQGRRVQMLTRLGAKPLESAQSPVAVDFYRKVATTTLLVTTRVVSHGVQRFGFGMSAHGARGTFVGTAGEALPGGDRRINPSTEPLTNGLNIAVYFGKSTNAHALIATTAAHLPLSGIVSRQTVHFGSSFVTLVMSPNGPLAGFWSASVPWGILVVGIVFTLVIAAMAERLLRRGELAELLAAENRSLFYEQRHVAETLQQSLLPQELPSRDEVELAVRYLPGIAGIDVGGDWYDAIEMHSHLFFTVGDVAGRGLEAATLMSVLSNAIRAFALDGVDPATVLSKITPLLRVAHDGRFATVVCGLLDLTTGEVVLANAGHPEPLLLREGRGAEFVRMPVGPPVGVGRRPYRSVRLSLEHGATLLIYTDGLIERRGRPLSTGKELLRRAAKRARPVQRLLDEVIAELVPGGATDDIAIMGVRWN